MTRSAPPGGRTELLEPRAPLPGAASPPGSPDSRRGVITGGFTSRSLSAQRFPRPCPRAPSCRRRARVRTSAFPTARIWAASTPAFVAPGFPIDTVATGTPGGICTVDSSALRPFNADESIGTPMTGIVECAATTCEVSGGAGADDEELDAARGHLSNQPLDTLRRPVRRGDRSLSHAMPSSRSTSTDACITGASESEPIRIKTSICMDLS